MDMQKVVGDIKLKYPGKKIAITDEGEYQEVVCEIEPSSVNSERSTAVAVVGKSKPHKHLKTTEIYELISGELTVEVDGVEKVLAKAGDRLKINPGQSHSASGAEAWFYTYSTPGWTPEDHIVI